MKAKLVIVVLIVLIVLIVWKTNEQKQISLNKEPIKIGWIGAQTGVGVTIGEEELKGTELAAKLINDKGGILGHKIEIVAGDVSIDKLKNGASVAQKLINVDKVVAIVGPQWDEPAYVVVPIADEAKIPIVGPDTTDAIKEKTNSPYLFSTWYDNRVGVEEILKYAKDHDLKKFIVLMQQKAGFWKFTRDAFVEKAPNYGVEIVKEFEMGNLISFDFRTELALMKQIPHDALFFVMSDPTQCVFLKQKKELGIKTPIFGTESTGNPASLGECAALMEGTTYFSTPKTGFGGYKKFETAFTKEYGRGPLFPSAVTAFDAVGVIARGLEASKLAGGEMLQKAMSGISDYTGASQPIVTFKPNGFVVTPDDTFEMMTVRDGKFTKVE